MNLFKNKPKAVEPVDLSRYPVKVFTADYTRGRQFLHTLEEIFGKGNYIAKEKMGHYYLQAPREFTEAEKDSLRERFRVVEIRRAYSNTSDEGDKENLSVTSSGDVAVG